VVAGVRWSGAGNRKVQLQMVLSASATMFKIRSRRASGFVQQAVAADDPAAGTLV